MQSYRGKSVFEGIAVGRVQVIRRRKTAVDCVRTENTEAELERYRKAVETAAAQLSELSKRVSGETGRQGADIFEAHRVLLQDNSYRRTVEDLMRESRMNAEYAVSVAGERLARKFADMRDEELSARAADVRDISERLLKILRREHEDEDFPAKQEEFGPPVIIVAEDLSPSETVRLDRNRVLAFVTAQGSAVSHTAVLAGMMGIPALVGTGISMDEIEDGSLGIVDGFEGLFYLNPDNEMAIRARRCQRDSADEKERLRELVGKKSVTKDGRRILLCANIGSIRELKAVRENDADGVGLFRSEFIYLERNHFPTEEEQFRIYRTVAENLEGKQAVIRTLDIGADKRCDYLEMEPEENPALGCRAIRYCLRHPEIFRTQLRALFRAAAFGNLAVLYPMITGVDELRRVKVIAEEVKAELDSEGMVCGRLSQGIMIETPAAVMMSAELAGEADFFSIGTNDLTQYTLALDRQNHKLAEFFDARHPAVLKMIEIVVENGHRAGIPVGICGELGADSELTERFLDMGVDELSVAPGKILPLRRLVRETDTGWQK